MRDLSCATGRPSRTAIILLLEFQIVIPFTQVDTPFNSALSWPSPFHPPVAAGPRISRDISDSR